MILRKYQHFFLGRQFEIQGIYKKSLTSLVFYTNVVLKIVNLYVRLNSVLEALCNFRSWVQVIGNWKPVKRDSVMFFDFTLGVYFKRR